MGGLVVSALINAGIGFFAQEGKDITRRDRFKNAGITLGLTVGSYLLHKYLSREEAASTFATEQKPREREIRSAVVPANYVFGTTKISGALVNYLEQRRAPVSEDTIPGAYFKQFKTLACSEIEIDEVLAIYIGGVKMPFKPNDTGVYIPDLSAWDDQIADLESRLNDLGCTGQEGIPTNQQCLDLIREIQDLKEQRDEPVWFTETQVGVKSPNVRVAIDRNRSNILSAADQHSEINLGEPWGSPNMLKDLAWGIVELTARDVNGPKWTSASPRLELVVKSAVDGEYTENPAKIIRWLLLNVYKLTDDDLENYIEAEQVCEESIVIDEVSLASPADKLNQVRKVLWPQAFDPNGNLITANLPSVADQAAGLREWNKKFAGYDNAEKRYQMHGSITSLMLSAPQRLFDQLGFAMGGWLVPNGGKIKFVPGYASEPKLAITEDNLAGLVTQELGPIYEKRFSAISGQLAQLKTADYTKHTIAPVIDGDLVSTDGYREESLGILPFQNSEIAARRLLAKYRRRNSPLLKRLKFEVTGLEFYKLSAGDRITLNFPSEDIYSKIFRLISISANINGTLKLECIEEPDSVWDDDFDPSIDGIRGLKPKITTEISRVLSASISWRMVSVASEYMKYAGSNIKLAKNPDFTRGPYRGDPQTLPDGLPPVDHNNDNTNPPDDDGNGGGGGNTGGNNETKQYKKLYLLDVFAHHNDTTASLRIVTRRKISEDLDDEVFTYNTNLTPEEHGDGTTMRTMQMDSGELIYFEPDQLSDITVSLYAFTEPNQKGLVTSAYIVRVIPPGTFAMGDLDDYSGRVPELGDSLRTNKSGKWTPDRLVHVVEELPESTENYLPGTIIGVAIKEAGD